MILGIEEHEGSQITRAALCLGFQQTIYIKNDRSCLCGRMGLCVKRKIKLKYRNTQSKINTDKGHLFVGKVCAQIEQYSSKAVLSTPWNTQI